MAPTERPETERRLVIARRVVALLAARTELAASLLAGSAAQGTSDEHSDIDLLNYYGVLPDRGIFDEAMAALGAEPIGEPMPPDGESFLAFHRLDGIQLQTGGELVSALEQRLDRIAAADVDWMSAKVATGLLEGMPLHGEKLLAAWRERARYPEALRQREVERNLGIFPIWALDDHLTARDAELFRRQMLLDGAFRVVAVLSAVNRLYFTTFQFKRAQAHIERMEERPENLSERLDRVANLPPAVAADELKRLVDETKAIVKRQLPTIDIEAPWRVDNR